MSMCGWFARSKSSGSFGGGRLGAVTVRALWVGVMGCVLVLGMARFGFAETLYQFESVQQEMQYKALIEDFRCPTCQNQNLAGSDAPIAQDLKQKTYEMVKEGRSDTEIRAYMFERYGDFISYKPPVRPSTWLLWFFPPLLFVILLGAWVIRAKRKRHKATTHHQHTPLNAHEQARLQTILDTYQGATDVSDAKNRHTQAKQGESS